MVLLRAVLLLIVVAAHISFAAPPPGVPVVRVGRTISKSGFYAIEALPLIRGIQFWYEWLNQTSNLLFTNNGTQYYLELVEYDDASSTANVDVLYRALDVLDGVVATFGPWSTALTAPAIARTNASGVPIIFTAGAPQFYSAGYQHSIGTFVTARNRLIPCMEEFQRLNASKAVIIASTDPFQQTMLPLHASTLELLDISVVWTTTVQLNETDFTDAVGNVTFHEADLVICLMETTLYGPFLTQLRKNSKANDEPSMIYNINGGAVASAYEIYKWPLDGAFGATQWSPFLPFTDPVFGSPRNFSDRYSVRFNTTPDFVDALAVMGGFIMLDALERTASFSHADMIEALRTTNIPESIIGAVTFLPTGEINSSALCVQLLPLENETQRSNPGRRLLPVAPANLKQANSTVPITVIRPPGPKFSRSQKIGIIVGSTLAGVIVIAAIITVAVILFNRKYHVLFFKKDSAAKETQDW